MAEKSQRELYLSDPLHQVEHSNHDAVIPPWLVAEAGTEEEWEKGEKRSLEISSWARELRNKFLESFKTENRQMVQVWDPEGCAEWLKKKVLKDGEFDKETASEVLVAAQTQNEKAVEVMALMGYADEKQPKPESGSPTRGLKDVKVPETVKELQDASQEEQYKLHKKKAVGSYGIVLTAESCLVYCKGEKLAELDAEMCGGYPVLAAEIDEMETDKDVVAFFDLKNDLEEINASGWGFKPRKASPIVDGPSLQRLDQEPGPPVNGPSDPSDPANLPGSPARVDPLKQNPSSVVPGAPTPEAPNIPGAQ